MASAVGVRFTPESGPVRCNSVCPLWAKSGHSRRVRPFIEKRYRRDVEHARARAHYRFRSGLLAGPLIQNNNPDHGCEHQRATESRCQCPVIYCRDLHVCRLGGAANAICEVGHKATANFADLRKGFLLALEYDRPPNTDHRIPAARKPVDVSHVVEFDGDDRLARERKALGNVTLEGRAVSQKACADNFLARTTGGIGVCFGWDLSRAWCWPEMSWHPVDAPALELVRH